MFTEPVTHVVSFRVTEIDQAGNAYVRLVRNDATYARRVLTLTAVDSLRTLTENVDGEFLAEFWYADDDAVAAHDVTVTAY